MKYTSSFARAQKLVRYLLVLSLVSGAAGLLLYREGTTGQLVCVLLCAALIAAILVIAARDCRCPSCGKRIISGVLVLDTCPRCKRNLYTGDKPKNAKKR